MISTYSPEQAAQLLRACSGRWWVAGGLAIDLFLGEQTRPHEDLDIAIQQDDERSFRTHLKDWEVWPGLGGGKLEARPIAVDEDLPQDQEVLWCRPSAASDWAFELLLNKTSNGNWVFKRDERIQMSLGSIGLTSSNGIPYLRPEIVLLFKAKNRFEKDEHDFNKTISRLDNASLAWLGSAIQTVHPVHPWLKRVTESLTCCVERIPRAPDLLQP